MYNVSLDEQETVINYYPKKISEDAEIYTSDPVVVKKLRKLVANDPENAVIISEDEYGLMMTVPRSWIKISAPRKLKMTDEQRSAAADRLRLAREAKKE